MAALPYAMTASQRGFAQPMVTQSVVGAPVMSPMTQTVVAEPMTREIMVTQQPQPFVTQSVVGAPVMMTESRAIAQPIVTQSAVEFLL